MDLRQHRPSVRSSSELGAEDAEATPMNPQMDNLDSYFDSLRVHIPGSGSIVSRDKSPSRLSTKSSTIEYVMVDITTKTYLYSH